MVRYSVTTYLTRESDSVGGYSEEKVDHLKTNKKFWGKSTVIRKGSGREISSISFM